MKTRRFTGLTAMLAVGALALSACSSGGGDAAEKPGQTAEGPSTGIVTYASGEPQNLIIPTMTNESYGSRVVQNIYAGLVYYAADGSVQNDVAESIETEDNKVWTITLKEDQVFSDGSPVTAESFAKAWDYGATASNAQNLVTFFSSIEGFDVENDSSLIESGGLTVEDERTLVVTLKQPESDFPIRLGYAAFYPLPESFFADPDAYGQAPIGNGPYVLESWEHDSVIELRPNESYNGPRKAQNGGIDLVNYTDEDSQYNDLLGGQVDLVQNVPASAIATFEEELGDRSVNQPSAVIQVVTVPSWLPELQGEAGLLRRQAISMAINREQVTEMIFNNSRTPARDFTSPVIPGWSEDIPGNEVLTFDEAQAKDLWAQAEAISPVPAGYTLQIASNADSDHQAWIDAVCNTVRTVLEIGCEFYAYPTFDEFLDDRDNAKVPGLFRAGWQADYPSLSNFFGPLYAKGSGSNDGLFENADFEAKLIEAAGAPSQEEAVKLYQEAQSILFEQLPGIPLWYQNVTGGWSENVENVEFAWDGEPVLWQITKEA